MELDPFMSGIITTRLPELKGLDLIIHEVLSSVFIQGEDNCFRIHSKETKEDSYILRVPSEISPTHPLLFHMLQPGIRTVRVP